MKIHIVEKIRGDSLLTRHQRSWHNG